MHKTEKWFSVPKPPWWNLGPRATPTTISSTIEDILMQNDRIVRHWNSKPCWTCAFVSVCMCVAAWSLYALAGMQCACAISYVVFHLAPHMTLLHIGFNSARNPSNLETLLAVHAALSCSKFPIRLAKRLCMPQKNGLTKFWTRVKSKTQSWRAGSLKEHRKHLKWTAGWALMKHN